MRGGRRGARPVEGRRGGPRARSAPHFEAAVHGLKGQRHITDIRNYGLAAGLTIAALPGEPARRPYEIAMRCWAKGFYVRYGGDTIQLAPRSSPRSARSTTHQRAVRCTERSGLSRGLP